MICGACSALAEHSGLLGNNPPVSRLRRPISLFAALALTGALTGIGLAQAAAPRGWGTKGSKAGKTSSHVGPWISGVRYTLYGTGAGNACVYDVDTTNLPFAGYVAAGSDVWAGGEGCGRFLEIKGGTGPTCPVQSFDGSPRVVMVVDHCPECTNTHLDLTSHVWEQVTESSGCIIEGASYREVAGRWTDDVSLELNPGSSSSYLSVRPHHQNRPVRAIEVRSSGSSTWTSLPRVPGNNLFAASMSTPLKAPVSVRMHSITGETLVAADAVTSLTPSGTSVMHDMGWQFAGDFGMSLRRSHTSTSKSFVGSLSGATVPIAKVQLRGKGAAKFGSPIKLKHGRILAFERSKTMKLPISIKLISTHGETVIATDAITKMDGPGVDRVPAQFACTEKAETQCGDGLDNDCDGKVDAHDPDC